MNKQQEARAHRELVAVLNMTPAERREFSRMSRLVTDGIFDAVHPVLDDEDTTCPPWHFLPGPYQEDEDRTQCPNRDTHQAQRRRYEDR